MSKIKQQTSFKVHQSAEVLFPLFSAEGEKYWAPGWDYENVMGGSTDMHEDYVFLTAGHRSNQYDAHGQDHHEHDRHGDHHAKPTHSESGSDAHGHHSSEDHTVPKTIWLVKRHEPENYIVQLYRVEPQDRVAVITVQCKPLSENLTEWKLLMNILD